MGRDVKQITLTLSASEGLESIARQYGLVRDGKGDVSQLLQLIGEGKLIVVPKPPQLDS